MTLPSPPHLQNKEIRQRAEEFRQIHWRDRQAPVDVELITEQMGLIIDPISNLRDDFGIDAMLSLDRTILYVDLSYYTNVAQSNRVRFSFAHELGHLVLHPALFEHYQHQLPKDVYDWARTIRELHDSFEEIYERQADEFAGCLLVPCDELKRAARPWLDRLDAEGFSNFSSDDIRAHIAAKLHRQFEVAPKVVEIRLRKCGIIPNQS